MQNIRVINIPPLKVVCSGSITTMDELKAFDNWWSSIDVKQYITPRDFMWYNAKKSYMEWIFAIPEGHADTGGYELMDFPGGLYAVGTAKDIEDDFDEAKEIIHKWVADSKCFELSSFENDTAERYEMFHVITPKVFKDKVGYHLSDIFVPIVVK